MKIGLKTKIGLKRARWLSAVVTAFCFLLAAVIGRPVYAADGAIAVDSKAKLISVVRDMEKTLTTSFTVVIDNYTEEEFGFQMYDFVHWSFYQTSTKKSGNTSTITYNVTYNMAQRVLFALNGGSVALDDKETQVMKAAQKVLADVIKSGMNGYEKELAIHDYIVGHTRYSANDQTNMSTPYGCMIKGEAVCQGYAETARMLLSAAGVTIDSMGGKSTKGQMHMWNVIKIDGKWYQLDVTWDDPVMADGSDVLQHIYVNLTDQQMAVDHVWDAGIQKINWGTCDATDYDWFKKNGFIVTSNETFAEAVKKVLNGGGTMVEVRTSGIKAVDISIANALKDDSVKAAMQKAGITATKASTSKEQNVIKLAFSK